MTLDRMRHFRRDSAREERDDREEASHTSSTTEELAPSATVGFSVYGSTPSIQPRFTRQSSGF